MKTNLLTILTAITANLTEKLSMLFPLNIYLLDASIDKQQASTEIARIGFVNNGDNAWHLDPNSAMATSAYALCVNAQGVTQNCMTTLNPGEQQWVSFSNAAGWMYVGYDTYTSSAEYLGYFGLDLGPNSGIQLNNQGDAITVEIKPWDGVIGDPQAITVTDNNTPDVDVTVNATDNKNYMAFGINFSGYEWGSTSEQNDPPSNQDLNEALSHHIETIRLPFKLEYSSDCKTLDTSTDYMTDYLAYSQTAQMHHAKVINEPHNYLRCNNVVMNSKQCADLIGGFITAVPGDVELMNEPHDISATDLYNCYDAALPYAKQNYNYYIGGSAWQGTCNLVNADGQASAYWNNLSKLISKYADIKLQISVHNYWTNPAGCGGGGESECIDPSTALTANRVPQLTELARSHGIQLRNTELGVIISNNCLLVLNEFLYHIYTNKDVWTGFTWWTATPSDLYDWGGSAGKLLVLSFEQNADGSYVDARTQMLLDYELASDSDYKTIHESWQSKAKIQVYQTANKATLFSSPTSAAWQRQEPKPNSNYLRGTQNFSR